MSSFHRQSFKALSDRARHAEIFSDRALASLSRRAAIVLLTLKSQMSQMSQMHSLNPGNVTMSDNVCKTKTPNQPLQGFGSMCLTKTMCFGSLHRLLSSQATFVDEHAENETRILPAVSKRMGDRKHVNRCQAS